MNILKATQAQYQALNGYTNGINRLEFVERNGDWIVSEGVLQDPAFAEIKDQLEQLQVASLEEQKEEEAAD
jgi:hypothetical protein